MGMIRTGRDGEERAFVDEEQHVQMHGGGHIIFMESTERSDQTENSSGCWGEWEGRAMGVHILLLCPVERPRGRKPGLCPQGTH